jgi:glycine C-acetyltransferase
MTHSFRETIQAQLDSIRQEGLYKAERILTSPQQVRIQSDQNEVLNFCANNYLGLANHPEIIKAAHDALDMHGYGMASVRFICGTHEIHKQLEQAISEFMQMEDTILYSSCFDANAGLFETLLDEQDAIFSDRLNHASLIDGVRLCKANRYRYKHADCNHLERLLKKASKHRFKLIATDGVFSMDGDVAPLRDICTLAEKYDAWVIVDDSHATGFWGATGRGSMEVREVMGRVDIITSTFGKALGGASGGFTSGRKEVVELLRQRSRPYLFSNSISPVIAGANLKAVEIINRSGDLLDKLRSNTKYFRQQIQALGLDVRPGEHPIVPVMLGDARLAHEMADRLLDEGIYLIGFSYPVVPKGEARIRVQISAAHEREDLDQAIGAFKAVSQAMGIIH